MLDLKGSCFTPVLNLQKLWKDIKKFQNIMTTIVDKSFFCFFSNNLEC